MHLQSWVVNILIYMLYKTNTGTVPNIHIQKFVKDKLMAMNELPTEQPLYINGT